MTRIVGFNRDKIVPCELDCSMALYSGLLDGTLTTLEGGSVMTQLSVNQFYPVFTLLKSADLKFLMFINLIDLFFQMHT